jgi:hypothetical protein
MGLTLVTNATFSTLKAPPSPFFKAVRLAALGLLRFILTYFPLT